MLGLLQPWSCVRLKVWLLYLVALHPIIHSMCRNRVQHVTSLQSGSVAKVRCVSVGYGRSCVEVTSYLLLEMTVGWYSGLKGNRRFYPLILAFPGPVLRNRMFMDVMERGKRWPNGLNVHSNFPRGDVKLWRDLRDESKWKCSHRHEVEWCELKGG
jgi:hypothetical protein